MASRRRKTVLIWTKGLDDFLEGSARFNGGIAVQLTFWAKSFLREGWKVWSFSDMADADIEGISFVTFKNRKGLFAAVIDCFAPLVFLTRLRPSVVIFRGASRNLFFVSLWSKFLGVKLVFMGASNTDFEPENEIINYWHDRMLYRAGIRLAYKIVVQNETQKNSLERYYGLNDPLLIPNIWGGDDFECGKLSKEDDYLLWVANFRSIKRPRLYIDLARRNPEVKFLMIGGSNDSSLYRECQESASSVDNLMFLGGLPFQIANSYFQGAKLLVCTSESEGFPNTFLQAWANDVPVVTTFDPGGVVNQYDLGVVVSEIDQLDAVVNKLLGNDELYNSLVYNIRDYFRLNHDSRTALKRLIGFDSL